MVTDRILSILYGPYCMDHTLSLVWALHRFGWDAMDSAWESPHENTTLKTSLTWKRVWTFNFQFIFKVYTVFFVFWFRVGSRSLSILVVAYIADAWTFVEIQAKSIAFWRILAFEGYIDVGDGCWRRNQLVTILSPTYHQPWSKYIPGKTSDTIIPVAAFEEEHFPMG